VSSESHAQRVEGRWEPHPLLSWLLRLTMLAVPVAAAVATTWLIRSFWAPPASGGARFLWFAVLLGAALIVSLATERVMRRLLPLAMLLKLSMLFPDQAPSRFRVMRHAGSVSQLRAELHDDRADDATSDRAGKILGLVTALAAHDRKTRGHAERVRVFTDLLTEQLKLPEEDRYRLRWAALLHDIGKLSVQPDTLNKPSELDPAEWEEIKGHPEEGARLAGPLLEWLGPWADAIVNHHERFDGGGYPLGLVGDSISAGGRIVAVADSYDTMTSARTYQKPRSTAAARRELVACAGTQFDPVIVRAFLEISLPRLLWAVGPVSLLVHVPFLARLQAIGQASVAGATQTAAITAVAGVTAVGLLSGPTATVAAARPHHPRANPSISQPAPSPDPSVASTHAHGGGSTHHEHADAQASGPATASTPSPAVAPSPVASPTPTPDPTPSATPTAVPSPATGGADDGSGSGDGSEGGSGSSGGNHHGPAAHVRSQLLALRASIIEYRNAGHRVGDLVQRVDGVGQALKSGNRGAACDGLHEFAGVIAAAAHAHPPKVDPGVAKDWIGRARRIGTRLAC
jgi:HD-GYP domain-containing protein (c-di-GMP phosphodiesterase class II)